MTKVNRGDIKEGIEEDWRSKRIDHKEEMARLNFSFKEVQGSGLSEHRDRWALSTGGVFR